MRRLTCILPWLWLLATVGPGAAQDGYEAGGWTVAAENFSNGERACVATAPGGGDPLYTFTLIDRDFIITLLSTRIDWSAGQTVSATLAIDSRWSRRMNVSADFPSLLFFEFPFDDEVVERLRDGRVFRIDTARGTHKLGLSGSSAALAALWACAGRGAAPGATAAAEPAAPPNGIIEFPAGSWQGFADLGDGSDLPLCTVFGPGAEPGLLLNWSPSGLSIGLQDGGWSLTQGDRYPVTVSVDNRWRADLDALVIGENSVAIIIGDDRSAIDGLRLGSRLTISAAQQEFRFELRGSSAAIGALRDCYRRYAGALADLLAIAVPDTVPRTPEAPPAVAGAERGPELANGVYRRPMSLALSNVEELVRAQISPSARVWQNQQYPPYYEFRGASGIRDNGTVFGKVMEIDVPSGLIEMAMTTLYAEELSRCGDGGESGRLPVEFYPDLDLQYAIIRCGTNPGDRQVELVLMLIDTYGILYVIEGGYTDTFRMADLVLAIQSIGRGEGR